MFKKLLREIDLESMLIQVDALHGKYEFLPKPAEQEGENARAISDSHLTISSWLLDLSAYI